MGDVEAFRAKYAPVNDWLNKTARSQFTVVNYVRNLIEYCNWARLNPHQLLDERRQDKMKGEHEAEKRLDRFVVESELSHNLKWSIVIAVKSFYKGNFEDLSKGCGKISMLRQKPIRTPEEPDISMMIRDAPLRDKVLLLVLRDTGMREGSLAKLRWFHVWSELFDFKTGDLVWNHITPVLIRLTAKELKGRYPENQQICFLSPQTVELLLEYKNSLKLRQERLIKPDEFIFVSDHHVKGKKGVFQPIGVKGIAYTVRSAAKRVGKNFSPHDIRRLNQTALEKSQISFNWTRKMLGRRVRGEEDPYSQPKIEDLRQAFVRVLPFLAPEMKVTVEMFAIRLEMVRDFAKNLGFDPSRLIVADHRPATDEEIEQIKKGNPEILAKLPGFARVGKSVMPYTVAGRPEILFERKPTPEEEMKILQDMIASKFKVRDYDTGEVFDQKTGKAMTIEEYEAKKQRLKQLKAAKTKTE